MIETIEQLEEMLVSKEARDRYDFEKLVKYCAALANEGGGYFVLGVTDKRPRRIVGTRAFRQPERTRSGLIQHLHLNIDFSILDHPHGRVLAFHVPSRPLGTPVKYKGIYWQRQGDSLVSMSEDRLREIFAESGRDFSAEICSEATMADLDLNAIEDFRRRWIAKSRNPGLANLPKEQILRDAELLLPAGLTYAALVLFGTRSALGRFFGSGGGDIRVSFLQCCWTCRPAEGISSGLFLFLRKSLGTDQPAKRPSTLPGWSVRLGYSDICRALSS